MQLLLSISHTHLFFFFFFFFQRRRRDSNITEECKSSYFNKRKKFKKCRQIFLWICNPRNWKPWWNPNREEKRIRSPLSVCFSLLNTFVFCSPLFIVLCCQGLFGRRNPEQPEETDISIEFPKKVLSNPILRETPKRLKEKVEVKNPAGEPIKVERPLSRSYSLNQGDSENIVFLHNSTSSGRATSMDILSESKQTMKSRSSSQSSIFLSKVPFERLSKQLTNNQLTFVGLF